MEIKVDQVEKRSWTEIDLKQIERNFQIYKNHLRKNVSIMAVIKADAYGHGDVMVARTRLRAWRCDGSTYSFQNGCQSFCSI